MTLEPQMNANNVSRRSSAAAIRPAVTAGAAATTRSVLVVQPLPGIGDMVWHLPHIRALARHVGAPVTLLAKPRSHADELFAAEDTVREIIWLDRNPPGRRGIHDGPGGLLRLIGTLRQRRFDAAVLLHHSSALALATLAAGIPVRQGYGVGRQRWFLNVRPYLPRSLLGEHQFQRATRFLRAAGIDMPETEPCLAVTPGARDVVLERLSDVPRPLVAMGIGSSEASRQWGATRIAALAGALLDAQWPSVALLGGSEDAELLHEIQVRLGADAARLMPALGWPLTETAALLAEAAFYVGNNTGVMNMAAAVGIPTYALFGTTPPFHHSRRIVPIVSPSGGPIDGMERVTVAAVLDVIRVSRGTLEPVRAATYGAG
jgi:heptosyltransferase II